MIRKLLQVVCLITILAIAASAAEVTFANPTIVGLSTLQPGKYTVKLVGNVAVFVDAGTNKSFSAVFVVLRGQKRSTVTNVVYSNQNGVDKVDAIQIAGEDSKLIFK